MIYLQDPDFTLHLGDAAEELAEVEAESVDCCITSPPYYAQRDYGTGIWEGGRESCTHEAARKKTRYDYTLATSPIHGKRATALGTDAQPAMFAELCPTCGARRVDRQIGLEQTVESYIDKLAAVFEQVRRVLKPEGTLWVNLGSKYADGAISASSRRPDAASYDTGDTRRQDSPDSDCAYLDLCDECAADLLNRNQRTYLSDHEAALPALPRDLDTGHSDFGLQISQPDALVSTKPQSWPRPPAVCWRCGSQEASVSLQVPLTSSRDARSSSDMAAHMLDNAPRESEPHKRDRDVSGTAWVNYIPKEKDLIPVPWLFALTLQARGWYLRADIIWAKRNVMPESCKDRPTCAHEYVFLFVKGNRYFYNYQATLEPNIGERWGGPIARNVNGWKGGTRIDEREGREYFPEQGRNMRSVWEMATEALPDAHYAPYPQELVRRCINAGCPEGGLVLDPFLGSGTTAFVARAMGRRCLGIELSPSYCALIARRTQQLSLFATGGEYGEKDEKETEALAASSAQRTLADL